MARTSNDGEAGAPSPRTSLVLVEPGAGVRHGHFVEKLGLWCDGLAAVGYPGLVCCWEPPVSLPNGATGLKAVAPAAKRIWRHLPARVQTLWADFCTYRLAFKISRRRRLPVLGLSASGPIPVALAAATGCPRDAWGQIVMYGGLEQSPEGLRVRPRALRALQRIATDGCQLLCNAPLTAETLMMFASAGTAERTHYVPDPIYVSPAYSGGCADKRGEPATLLVPGEDDHRRTPLWHLAQADFAVPVETLLVLQPGKKELRAAGGGAWVKPAFVRDTRVISDYATGAALASLFRGAKFAFIAYVPQFLQGSANLALAIASGTPVLCSRFPYAEHLFRTYGRLGELFEFGDLAALRDAWARLSGWAAEDWAEFDRATRRLIGDVSHRAVARRAVELLGLRTMATAPEVS